MVKMGRVYSCGYTDDGIGHNCCKIVDEMKKRIKTFTDYESKLTENEKMILFEFTEIMDGKKNES